MAKKRKKERKKSVRERKLDTNSRKTLVLLDEQIRKKGVWLTWSAPRLNSTDRGSLFFVIAAEAVESKKKLL